MSLVRQPPLVKGWCPRGPRAMETGDGFLLRISRAHGRFTNAELSLLAALARRFGNGLLDLTQRANLQIRGILEENLPFLVQKLTEGCLLPDQPEIPILGSPLSGLDETALINGLRLTEAVRQAFEAFETPDLPDKFSLVIDDGGLVPLDCFDGDIRLTGRPDGLCIAVAAGPRQAVPVALLPLEDGAEAGDITMALTRAFLEVAHPKEHRRMAAAIKALGLEHLLEAAGLKAVPSLPPVDQKRPPLRLGPFGNHLAVGAPYGRLTAEQIEELAAAAPEIRLAPGRAILLPNRGAEGLPSLAKSGFITSGDDSRLAIAACPGRSGCACGEIETRTLADRLAPLLDVGKTTLHISGCLKGCAHPSAAEMVIVGRAGGRMDIVLRGRADAAPSRRNVTLAEIESILKEATAAPATAKILS